MRASHLLGASGASSGGVWGRYTPALEQPLGCDGGVFLHTPSASFPHSLVSTRSTAQQEPAGWRGSWLGLLLCPVLQLVHGAFDLFPAFTGCGRCRTIGHGGLFCPVGPANSSTPPRGPVRDLKTAALRPTRVKPSSTPYAAVSLTRQRSRGCGVRLRGEEPPQAHDEALHSSGVHREDFTLGGAANIGRYLTLAKSPATPVSAAAQCAKLSLALGGLAKDSPRPK